MKISYLCALGLLLAAFACGRKDSPIDDPDGPPPPIPVGPSAQFKVTRYGTPDLVKLFLASSTDKTIATIKNAPGNTGFTWEITGSNGMKKATDTTVKGSGSTDAGGNASINTFSLYDYKDGDLILNVHFSNSTETKPIGGTKKEEFIIRSYTDLMAINDYTGNSLTDTFVQAQDIAFPDTIFTSAPVKYNLKANYDGRGYKITNLTIVVPARGANSPIDLVGLFSSIGNRVIVKNVRLELSAAGIKTTTYGICGGIAGINSGSILYCSVRGNIKSPGTWAEVGGITGETNNGRIIGSSFKGSLEGDQAGGLSAEIYNSYLNMCYSNYTVVSNFGGALAGTIVGQQDGLIHDTVYNCYAYVSQATVSFKYHSLFYTGDPNVVKCLYDACYSNYGIAQPKAISYTTGLQLNGMLLPLQVSNLPADITAPPANKPFKYAPDQSQPPLLWWEKP